MKKIFLLVLLVHLLPYPVSGSSAASSTFHESLPENRREEITLIDNHTVKVGLGPDQRSVSCTILDAVGSIPAVNGTTEPDVVFVNKEQVHHIRKGLYAWDRAGKYRVRLTTKYIREFGEIIVRVVDPATANSDPKNTERNNLASFYHRSLPKNKREEITIIDHFMVEVGLGPDLKKVQSNLQDAIKSIPSVDSETFPEFVFVNGEPVFFIGNGLYSWDSEGSNPVRLTTPYIKKFGNIRVSIPGYQSPQEIVEPANVERKETPKEKVVAEVPAPAQKIIPEDKAIPRVERVAKIPEPKQGIESEKPSPAPTKSKELGLKGFRKAHFGMDISQVKKAIREDFDIEDSLVKTFGKEKNIIAVSTDKLSANGDMASVQYLFSNSRLVRVNIVWTASENTDNLAVRLIQQFLNLRFLKIQTLESHETHLFHGKDSYGNELKLSWAKNPNGNSRPLSLSYIAFSS